MVKISMQRFNLAWIQDDATVVAIGKRNTGKSYVTRDILHSKRDLPVGTVISPTEKVSPFFSSFVPHILIHSEVTEQRINSALARQDIAVRAMRREQAVRAGGRGGVDPRAFLVLDDCLAENGWVRSKPMRRVFMNGRHYKLFCLITMQYSLGVPPELRGNVDYVFIMREPLMTQRKRLYEHYAGMFRTFDVFCQVMDQCTSNYECIVINNRAQSNRIEDLVFWYKASDPGEFRMCPPEIWAASDEVRRREEAEEARRLENAGGEYGQEEDAAAMLDAMRVRNRPLITVCKR